MRKKKEWKMNRASEISGNKSINICIMGKGEKRTKHCSKKTKKRESQEPGNYCDQFAWEHLQYIVNINKQEPQLNRVGRWEGGILMSCDDSRAQQKEERLLLFPGKGSANEETQDLYSL